VKIVIVGASGNVGTALLRAVASTDDIADVVGVARRVPRGVPVAPYDAARWVGIDVAGAFGASVISALARVMDGADAVIQLAWVIQPNHDREFLRRVNVLGTARVLEAARLARVPHVVVASSVSAYAGVDDDVLRDESWPTTGIPSSEYSVDKATVERLLDAHEREHPEVLITRLRPALIFQRVVGAQVTRNFMGPLIPRRAFGGALPAVPLPAGTAVQAVHADDVAQAYLAAVRGRFGGAFNIAAHDVVRAPEVADILAGGRAVAVPPRLMRAAALAAWKARALATSPGWLDLADRSPLMATDRAREVLGWAPHRSAFDTLAELFDGMRDGAGTSSPPLRPR
jgi:UDP-glucose 4-epimerase